MNQFKDLFLGREKRDYTRATTVAEVHARQRQAQRPRQRRPVAAASHVLRDARQLLVRRLLQAGRDRVRLGAADDGLEAAGRTGCSRRSSRARPASRATTRRYAHLDAARARRRASPSSGWPTTSGRWATPARAAAAPRSTTSAATTFPCDEEPGRAAASSAAATLRRGLEQRVHGVRPPGRRHAEAAAGAVDRHRHGPRADHGGDPGQALELRHRPVHADPRRDRRARRPALRRDASTTRPTSRCA